MGDIYLIGGEGELVEMKEQSYDSEDLLQELLAKYPNILAGNQMDDSAPRRWLLISREASLPSDDSGVGRWSIDHLFLDQDAIPTIVEVKRSSDTRIRREVVGQMLEYAANAVVYWPTESVRAQFESACQVRGMEPQKTLGDFLEGGIEAADEFWQKAKTNLQASRVRLVFVADEIPPELRRVVEFLNGQMDPAEVLGVEVKQYVSQGLKALVPRVIGQTAEAQQKKSPGPRPSRQWDEASFFLEMERLGKTAEAEIVRRILQWARKAMPRIWWGRGAITGSVVPMFDHKGIGYQVFTLWTNGTAQIQFQTLQNKPPFDDLSRRLELLHRFNEVPGIQFSDDAIAKWPGFSLLVLQNEDALKGFLSVVEWYIQQVKSQ